MKQQNLGQNVDGLKKGNVQPNISSTLRKGTIVCRRVISELELEEGDIIMNEKQILSEIESYFMNLYSSKTDVSEEHFSGYVEQY